MSEEISNYVCEKCNGPVKSLAFWSVKKMKYYGQLACLGECKDGKFPYKFFGGPQKPDAITVLIDIKKSLAAMEQALCGGTKMAPAGTPLAKLPEMTLEQKVAAAQDDFIPF